MGSLDGLPDEARLEPSLGNGWRMRVSGYTVLKIKGSLLNRSSEAIYLDKNEPTVKDAL